MSDFVQIQKKLFQTTFPYIPFKKRYIQLALATTGEYCCEKISKIYFHSYQCWIDVMQHFMPIIQNFFLFGVNSVSLKI